MLRVVLAQPRGFCAGVERAIEIVERALRKYGPPIYVRHEIVHNRHVVEDLRRRGAVFVDHLAEIPPGGLTIFSAHGVARRVEDLARERALPVIDATCPLVAKVHGEGRRYAAQGREIVLIGHEGHAEVEGTIGQIPGPVHLVQTAEDVAALAPSAPDALAYVTQTTLSVDDTRNIIAALKQRFPDIVGPDVRDICYATQNRQQAVRELANEVDLILVVGSPAARDRRGTWQAELPDRRRLRAESGMVHRHHLRRADRRGLGPGIAGAGGDRRAAPVHRGFGRDARGRGRGRAFPFSRRTGRRLKEAFACPCP
jgi:4-hydroxy-3-methylbut-2-enyl diphosphate reductase